MGAHQDAVRIASIEEHGKVGRPSAEGGGADLQHILPQQSQHALEVGPFGRIHRHGIDLSLYCLGVGLGDEHTQFPDAGQFFGGQIHSAKTNAQDGRVGRGASRKEASEDSTKVYGTVFIQESGRGDEVFRDHEGRNNEAMGGGMSLKDCGQDY